MDPPDQAPADQDILELLRGGDAGAAFGRLADRYEQKVYRLCLSLLRAPDQAEDAAQESLVRIWRALPRYDGRASLSTWIYTITRNRCLTVIERRRDLDSLSEPEVQHAADTAHAVQPDTGSDTDGLLRELVEALPERFRRVITLYYYEDRSVAEVADMLGVPEGTVKASLHRARAALLERVRALGLADPLLWLEKAA
jgi:RNA polymerase sigma-70 factor (ECF subfamily)